MLYKAAAFDPSIKYDSFFKEYVCKAGQSVDIENLVARYESLLRLRDQANLTARQVEELQKLENVLTQYRRHLWNVNVHNYMEKLLLELEARQAADAQEKDIENCQKRLLKLQSEEAERTDVIEAQRRLSDDLLARLNADESRRQMEKLKDQISGIEKKISEYSQIWKSESGKLNHYCRTLQNCLDSFKNRGFQEAEGIDSESEAAKADQLNQILNTLKFDTPLQALEMESRLLEAASGTSELNSENISMQTRLKDRLKELNTELEARKAELEDARKGIVHFPKQTVELKRRLEEAFESRGIDAHVVIVGAETQILNDKWRNAIEGYMDSQKKNLLVDEKYFEDAEPVMKAYRAELKRKGIPLKAQVVDVRKVRQKMEGKTVRPGTLACETSSDDERVDLYVKWILGNVHE
ncbi:MAG: hypothetical protein HUJ54_14490 [Erysipelotrichaceae bacterium]|nr:hypothetical protein [Erysipelotrichaceae bacterium]